MKKTFENFRLKNFLLIAVIAFVAVSCDDDDDSLSGEETARLSVRMTDAPGDYEAVNVHVEDVMIQTTAETENNTTTETEEGDSEGWVSLDNVETGIYDLLELTGGVSQLLADTEVPAGYVGQMRLVLGNDNSVVINGEEEPLATPSAEQSGLKLQIDQDFEAGENYSFLLDFDVEQSVVSTGNGGLILKPVIRVSAEAGASTITGEVHPTDEVSLVTASSATHTISAYTDAEGQFVLHGVPEGTYQITVTPNSDSGLQEVTESDVEVTADSAVEMETIFLE